MNIKERFDMVFLIVFHGDPDAFLYNLFGIHWLYLRFFCQYIIRSERYHPNTSCFWGKTSDLRCSLAMFFKI